MYSYIISITCTCKKSFGPEAYALVLKARYLYAKWGDANFAAAEEARQRLDRFIEENQSWGAFLIATIYARNEELDSAFDWIDKAYQQRDGWMATILNEPLFANLHDDPRWDDVLERMNFPR